MAQSSHHHDHDRHHLDEDYWTDWADHAEVEGEVLLGFVTDTVTRLSRLRGAEAPPVRRVLDVGSGPGVGTCELARLFPGAEVVAVDNSPEMLERATRRAAAAGLSDRVSVHLAELPDGLDGVAPVDAIWSSMALHHVGDEVAALQALRDLLTPHGLVVIVERAEPLRVVPDDELSERMAQAGTTWFEGMRAALPDVVESQDLPSMMDAAGLHVLESRIARLRLDPPLPESARQLAADSLRRARHQFEDHLDAADLRTLDELTDPDNPGSVLHRADAYIAASRLVAIATAS